jgi:hypothetical protein
VLSTRASGAQVEQYGEDAAQLCSRREKAQLAEDRETCLSTARHKQNGSGGGRRGFGEIGGARLRRQLGRATEAQASVVRFPSRNGCNVNGVSKTPTDIAREGLEAWRAGDFETIERILDPDVEWGSSEPGESGCHGREDVMQTIRERYEQGFAMGELQLRAGGEDAVILIAHPSEVGGPDWPDETATVMRFHGRQVVSMQDYRTEAEALKAVA